MVKDSPYHHPRHGPQASVIPVGVARSGRSGGHEGTLRKLSFDAKLRASSHTEVGTSSFAVGGPNGACVMMPRCPKLYSKEKKRRTQEQRAQQEVDEQLATKGVWNQNYTSIPPLADTVREVLRPAKKRSGVVLGASEERHRFSNLVIASLGALKKEAERVLFKSTKSKNASTTTHLRDQERSPVATGLKRSMREKASRAEPTFDLTADVKEAHRQASIHRDDWHILGSAHLRRGRQAVSILCTFGVSAATYYKSRVAASLGRLTQYLTGRHTTSHLDIGGVPFRPALLVIFLLTLPSSIVSQPVQSNGTGTRNDFRLCRTVRDRSLLLAHPTDGDKRSTYKDTQDST